MAETLVRADNKVRCTEVTYSNTSIYWQRYNHVPQNGRCVQY